MKKIIKITIQTLIVLFFISMILLSMKEDNIIGCVSSILALFFYLSYITEVYFHNITIASLNEVNKKCAKITMNNTYQAFDNYQLHKLLHEIFEDNETTDRQPETDQ